MKEIVLHCAAMHAMLVREAGELLWAIEQSGADRSVVEDFKIRLGQYGIEAVKGPNALDVIMERLDTMGVETGDRGVEALVHGVCEMLDELQASRNKILGEMEPEAAQALRTEIETRIATGWYTGIPLGGKRGQGPEAPKDEMEVLFDTYHALRREAAFLVRLIKRPSTGEDAMEARRFTWTFSQQHGIDERYGIEVRVGFQAYKSKTEVVANLAALGVDVSNESYVALAQGVLNRLEELSGMMESMETEASLREQISATAAGIVNGEDADGDPQAPKVWVN